VQMLNVSFSSCKKVIGAYDLVPLPQKSINQMRSKKSRPSGN
jgi:hypothetical protein